tara:strand:- start:2108 stop:2473 length:366 start_codon:yes stop_codon:yes gene_type:complete
MIKAEIKIQGQLLLGVPKEIALKVANQIVTHIALWGEKDVKDQLYPGHGYDTGMLQRAIRGRLIKNFHGEIDPSGVYYAIYAEKGNGRGFLGYHMFANTRQRIAKKDWRKVVQKNIKRFME